VTLKILNNHSRSKNEHQRDLEEQITQQNLSHRGWYFIRPCCGHFEIPSSEQNPHLCLIYEPQRETMLRFQDHFIGRKIPLPIAKAYITCLLLGLEYLHAECRVIHTGMESLALPK
jgi:serine/threonine protein kinase